MGTMTLFLTAIALAMDAFAVSITSGVCIGKTKAKHSLIFGLYFGIFQLAMTVIGFLAGSTFSNYIESYDHWIAFGLLVFVGGKMFYDSTKNNEDDTCAQREEEITCFKNMAMLSIATSIDAMAIGITFSVENVNIFVASIIIGVVAFIFSAIGVQLGGKVGSKFKSSAEKVGGIILIAIGIKILFEHMI